MVPTPMRSATLRMESAGRPSVSAISMAVWTMRSTLRSGLPLRLARSVVLQRSARLRAGSPLPGYSIVIVRAIVPYSVRIGTAGAVVLRYVAVCLNKDTLRNDRQHSYTSGGTSMQRIASTLGAISTAGILLLAIPGTAQAAYGNLTVDSTTIKNPHGCFNSHRYPMFVANETDAVAEIYTGPNCSGG